MQLVMQLNPLARFSPNGLSQNLIQKLIPQTTKLIGERPLINWKKSNLNLLECFSLSFHHIISYEKHCHQAKGCKDCVQDLRPKLLQQTQEEQTYKEIYHLLQRQTR